ncbi:zinc ribbon domain-containing protein [Selenomonas sp. AB3002]|uniref:zinc ribbon domain-containing protein n=1 Tax=Selenomonas sp. AB3002 TaxID=1392502 RepID=UPI000495250A
MAESLNDNETDMLKESNKIICPNCSSENESDWAFCYSCGTKLPNGNEEQSGTQINMAGMTVPQVAVNKYKPLKRHIEIHVPTIEVEEESVFAKDLPSWSIEPPQLPVRRVRDK